MTPHHCEVLVIGAGPVGLTAAAELRRRGVGVRCVDATVHHNVSTKALGLQARTLELSERLGVVEDAVARGLPVRKFNILSEERRIAKLDLGGLDTPYPYLLMLPQNVTEDILRARLEELGGRVEYGVELIGFTQNADGVDAVLRDGSRQSEHVHASWMIGADGAHSTVRHLLGLRFEGGTFREEFATADVRLQWQQPMDELFAYLNRGNFIAYFPMVGGWHRVAIAYTSRRAPQGEVTLAEVQQAIDACGPRGARAVDIADRSRFVIHQRTVEQQSIGRVFLAGDAAHVHSVVGAQGLNIGVQDSFNLSWKLAAVIAGKATPALLDTYAAERRPAARRIVKGTQRATRMTLLRRPPAVMARRYLAPLVLRRLQVRSTIEHALAQLNISYRAPGEAALATQPLLTGDRAADASLLHGSAALSAASLTRLFDLIRTDELSLVLIGSADDVAAQYDSIHRVAAEFPMITEYLVLPDRSDPVGVDAAATVLLDAGNTLRRIRDSPRRDAADPARRIPCSARRPLGSGGAQGGTTSLADNDRIGVGGIMNCTHPHVLVTGASTGIGRATALRLAEADWHVYEGVRRPDDGEALRHAAGDAGHRVTPLLLDVTAADQIHATAAAIADHVGATGLNALVNNAGIGVTSPMEVVSLQALRFQFEVNVFGQVAVTQAVLPLLRRASGRIVMIGSIGDRFAPPFGGPLAASKSAIASLADALRQELAPWNVRVVLLEPASIHTDAIDKLERDAQSTVAEFPAAGVELYGDSYLGMVDAAVTRERRGSPPAVVADVVLKR